LVLQVTDVELDAFFLIVQVETRVTKTLDLVDLRVFAKLWVEVVIVVVVILFFHFFLLGLLAVFVALTIILLHLLRSSSLLRDLLIEGENLLVMLMVSVYQVMELSQEFCLLFFDVFDFLSLRDEFSRDFLDLLDDEALRLSALFQLP